MVFGRRGTNTVSARTANCQNFVLWPTVNSHWYASRQPQTSHDTALRWLGTFELPSQEHQTRHETAFGWLRTSGFASQEHQTSRTSEPASGEPRTSHETGGECVTGGITVWCLGGGEPTSFLPELPTVQIPHCGHLSTLTGRADSSLKKTATIRDTAHTGTQRLPTVPRGPLNGCTEARRGRLGRESRDGHLDGIVPAVGEHGAPRIRTQSVDGQSRPGIGE